MTIDALTKLKTQKISIVIINWYYPTQIISVFFGWGGVCIMMYNSKVLSV